MPDDNFEEEEGTNCQQFAPGSLLVRQSEVAFIAKLKRELVDVNGLVLVPEIRRQVYSGLLGGFRRCRVGFLIIGRFCNGRRFLSLAKRVAVFLDLCDLFLGDSLPADAVLLFLCPGSYR
ncbi:MAG TPA: hypothetical protein VIL88_05895 [Devosia sp.]